MTRAFLDAVQVQYAWIDCAETVSSALLFQRIISCMRKITGRTDGEVGRVGGDVNAFVVEVQKLMDKLQGKIILVRPVPVSSTILYILVYVYQLIY